MSTPERLKQLSRTEILKARRELLIARCRLQRQQLIWQGSQLHHELRFVEMGLRAARAVRASPLLIAAITTGLAIIKPRRALWLAKTGLTSWRLWRKFGPMLAPLMPLIRSYFQGNSGPSHTAQNQADQH